MLRPLLFGFCLALSPLMVAAAQTATPITITAQSLDIAQTKGQAIFSGQVKVVQGDLTLTATRLEATYGKTLEEMVATGNVVFKRGETETASGERAVFNPQSQTLTLTGNTVTLTRGPSQLVGDALTYNLATQAARVTKQGGLVQATFIPQ